MIIIPYNEGFLISQESFATTEFPIDQVIWKHKLVIISF